MPKPTAAANATAMPVTTRRAFLKAVGALGTVTALAVPVAVLPKGDAAAIVPLIRDDQLLLFAKRLVDGARKRRFCERHRDVNRAKLELARMCIERALAEGQKTPTDEHG
ncbi:twin-arginine translocation signal domain-containing protein [Xanthobacter autotrophicus]|uniref:twin-arginine translocation signal domain-containing protein n=1 Tax=Xanthobacter autotrophicus TaxID=280 RepID=UPI0037281B93